MPRPLTLSARNDVFYEMASMAGPGIPVWSELRAVTGYRAGAWPCVYARSANDLAEIAHEFPWVSTTDDGSRDVVDARAALEGIGADWGTVTPHGAGSTLLQVRIANKLVLSVRTTGMQWPTEVIVVTLARTGFAEHFAAYRDRQWEDRGLPGFLRGVHADPKAAADIAESAARHVLDLLRQRAAVEAALPVAKRIAAAWKDAATAAEAVQALRRAV